MDAGQRLQEIDYCYGGNEGLVDADSACRFFEELDAFCDGGRLFVAEAGELGEVAGFGAAAEGRNPMILDKEGKGLAHAITRALTSAGMQPSDLDAAHCHGVSLPMYDRSETASYKRSLGKHAYRIPLSATKSMTGQAYAAGGLMGVASALMTLNTGVVPPTINLTTPDPNCDLDYVPQTARLNDVSSTLVTAISFGGTHSAAILRRMN